MTVGILGGVLLHVFYLAWGFNYARPTLYQLLDLPVQERPVEELEELCRELATEAVWLREQVPEDERGCSACRRVGGRAFPRFRPPMRT